MARKFQHGDDLGFEGGSNVEYYFSLQFDFHSF